MKNLFMSILFFSLALTSCSSDSTGESSQSDGITPPSWIQGTWAQKSGSPGDYTFTDTFKFKNDDFCALRGNTESCFAAAIQQSFGQVIAEQIITDTEYKLSIVQSSSISTTYHFIKISTNEIEYVISDNLPNMSLTKQ